MPTTAGSSDFTGGDPKNPATCGVAGLAWTSSGAHPIRRAGVHDVHPIGQGRDRHLIVG